MAKEFIYFFKHKKINGVKIGKTSGESVMQRFACFKTYSPYGAEILGFFECADAIFHEKRLHKKYETLRLSGEFFDISQAIVDNIVSEMENELPDITKDLKILFNTWMLDPSNNKEALFYLLKRVVKESSFVFSEETNTILKKYVPGSINNFDCFLTVKDIFDKCELPYIKMQSSRHLTSAGFNTTVRRVDYKVIKGFYVKNTLI